MQTIVVCSGGLDSIILAHQMAKEKRLLGLISFDYGQRHKKELTFAANYAKTQNVRHDIIDISTLGSQLTGSALTDNLDVPDGHYAEETMKVTIVPNRNAIMLTIAFGIAASRKAECVATAVHGGDHFIYPDCRPGFINAFNEMQNHALEDYANIKLEAPFVHQSKADIVKLGARIKAPFAETWSCYKGGEIHCGCCGTCVERREAFHLAGVLDPTLYADDTYWLEAVSKGAVNV